MSQVDTATAQSNEPLTLGDCARLCAVETWQVSRAIARGFLVPSGRLGRYRIFHRADLPTVRAALISAGYLRTRGSHE